MRVILTYGSVREQQINNNGMYLFRHESEMWIQIYGET